MKTVFISIFFTFTLVSVYCQIPTNGLVAHYPFDGNSLDYSGNMYHATPSTISGTPTPTTDFFGNPNSAYYFDGQDDQLHIGVPNAQNFHFNNEFTIAVWIHPDSQKTQNIFRCGGGNSHPYSLGLAATGTYVLKVKTTGASFYDGIFHHSYPTNQWIFMTAIANKDTMSIYANNILLDQIPMSSNTIAYNSFDLILIGSWQQLPSHTFHGKMDEMRIYNRALNAQERTALYNQGVVTSQSNINCPSSSLTVFPNPTQGHLQLDLPKDKEVKSIVVRDLIGKMVLNVQPTTSIAHIDMSSLPNGIYTVSAYFEDDTNLAKQIIKQ